MKSNFLPETTLDVKDPSTISTEIVLNDYLKY